MPTFELRPPTIVAIEYARGLSPDSFVYLLEKQWPGVTFEMVDGESPAMAIAYSFDRGDYKGMRRVQILPGEWMVNTGREFHAWSTSALNAGWLRLD